MRWVCVAERSGPMHLIVLCNHGASLSYLFHYTDPFQQFSKRRNNMFRNSYFWIFCTYFIHWILLYYSYLMLISHLIFSSNKSENIIFSHRLIKRYESRLCINKLWTNTTTTALWLASVFVSSNEELGGRNSMCYSAIYINIQDKYPSDRNILSWLWIHN